MNKVFKNALAPNKLYFGLSQLDMSATTECLLYSVVPSLALQTTKQNLTLYQT